MGQPPEVVAVGRGDDAYMAHAYLTKVPVAAIRPFILANTKPGDVVLDVFAGSGMTGVAAAMVDRRARLFDISRLGRHIGENYLNLVDADLFRAAVDRVTDEARYKVGPVYEVPCQRCERPAELSKTIWAAVVGCSSCGSEVNWLIPIEGVAVGV